MPELPEVETTRLGLCPVLEGAIIAKLELRRKDIRAPIPANLPRLVAGKKITQLRRRAKYILLDIEGGGSILVHLGMSGRMVINPESHNRHDHVILITQAGDRVVFNDPRRFGQIDWIAANSEDQHPALGKLGIEPLGRDFTGARLQKILANRKSPIKLALLDQRLIAGLGNIYVCEALYGAGIHPAASAAMVADDTARCAKLAVEIKRVLRAALQAGGSSLRDYRHSDGKLGYFQHQFAVYDQAGNPCPQCWRAKKPALIQRMVQGGRSSFFCPLHQPFGAP